MELLHMEGTRFSGGVVYAVMQDGAGGRHVYAINMSGNGFVQESAYKNVSAPDFDKATLFAFHSQFPYMFYAAGNRVYLHNLGSGRTYLAAECAGQVTMLKFNLYRQGNPDDLNDRSDEFMARQFELMVGSYDASAGGNNGGRLAFYRVDGVNNSVAERAGYDGFGRIVDVVYRERR
jgi:hypothetical protein